VCSSDLTMTLAVGKRTVHLGKPATSRIWVRALAQLAGPHSLLLPRVAHERIIVRSILNLPRAFKE
jgi:hypothetical protein